MREFLSTSFVDPFRKTTLILLELFLVFFAGTVIMGVSDNPLGVALCYASFLLLVLAFTHHMRTAKAYLKLFLYSLLGFVAFALLHNILHGLATMTDSTFILTQVLQVINVVCFLIALFLCPPAVIIGAVGSIIFLIKNGKFS